jgi:hypothetical protein
MRQTRSQVSPRRRTYPAEFAYARSCYGHLAGTVAVTILDSMLRAGWLVSDGDTFVMTQTGQRAFAALGIDVAGVRTGRRTLLRSCLDLTERRPHLAGALGDALLERFLAQRWVERQRGSRTLTLTASGREALGGLFGT